MTIRSKMIWVTVALGASAGVSGQSKVDRAFNATGMSCNQVTWSRETAARFPQIGSACRDVMQRHGKYFVKFQGEVQRVSHDGHRLTVNIKGGDRLSLAPPPDMSVYVNDKRTAIRELRPGDELNFYVPEDQLTAEFFLGDAATAAAQQVPIGTTPANRVATANPSSDAPASSTGVQTKPANVLPSLGLAGLLLLMWPRH